MGIQELPIKPSRGGDWLTWGDAADANLREFVLDHAGLKAQAATNAASLVSVNARVDALAAGKADLSALASVATTGRYADLIGVPATSIGVVLTSSTLTRPTADPNVRVVFFAPAPPVSVMLTGDVWEPTG